MECRNSDSSHTLVFTFNNNVVSGNAQVSSGIGNPSTPVFSGHTMTVNLTGVADAQRLTVSLTGVTDEFSQTLANTALSIKMLVGDINGNGVVSASDVAQAKAASGSPMLDTTFRADANASGVINATDIGLIKAKAGNSVP